MEESSWLVKLENTNFVHTHFELRRRIVEGGSEHDGWLIQTATMKLKFA